eukprot:gene616-1278_t
MAALKQSLQLFRQIGVRRMSNGASAEKLIKPALQVYGIEGRYAHALFSAASRKNQLSQVEGDLKKMKDLMTKDKLLTAFMMDPSINKMNKKNVLEKAFKDQKLNELVSNLFGALAENSRLAETEAIMGAFGKLMSSHRGEVQCTITSAKPLEQGHMKELTSALGGFIQKSETLKIDTKTDPSLIGGLVVDIGEYHIDMSIAAKVKKITKNLRDAI